MAKVILVAVNAVKMVRTFIGWRTWWSFLPVDPRKMECSHGRRVFSLRPLLNGLAVLFWEY
jgi:hypothetical protein